MLGYKTVEIAQDGIKIAPTHSNFRLVSDVIALKSQLSAFGIPPYDGGERVVSWNSVFPWMMRLVQPERHNYNEGLTIFREDLSFVFAQLQHLLSFPDFGIPVVKSSCQSNQRIQDRNSIELAFNDQLLSQSQDI
jgi:hypothetical protein